MARHGHGAAALRGGGVIGGEAVLGLLAAQGAWLVLPLAVAEGPVVTVLAAWLAQRGLLDLATVYVLVVLGDLLGDVLWYAAGRGLCGAIPAWLRERAALDDAALALLTRRFREKGGRTLLFGKLTHVAGLPILVAAGAARMPLRAFLGWNLLGTLPKSAVFTALGWSFGAAWERIDGALGQGALVLGAILIATLAARRTRRQPA